MKNRRVLIIAVVVTIIVLAVVYEYAILPFIKFPLTYSGFVEGDDVTVRSQVNAPVLDVLVEEGDAVTKGQVLARLDDSKMRLQVAAQESLAASLKAQVAQAEAQLRLTQANVSFTRVEAGANLNAAEAQHQLMKSGYQREDVEQAKAAMEKTKSDRDYAKAKYERAKGLFDSGVISRQDYETAENVYTAAKKAYETANANYDKIRRGYRSEQVRQSKEAVNAAKAEAGKAKASALQVEAGKNALEALKRQYEAASNQLGFMKKQLADHTITAPVDGVVQEKLVNPGDLASAGTPLFSMIEPTHKWVRIFVPAKDLGEVRVGAEAKVMLDGYPNRPFQGRVTFVADTAQFTPKNVQTKEDRIKQVFEVRVTIEKDVEMVKAGMQGDVIFHNR
jgi:multidrug resistance efflux pump